MFPPSTPAASSRDRMSADPAGPTGRRPVPPYTAGRILTVWAGAVVPMGLLAWVVAPAVAPAFGGGATGLAKALLTCLTVGLAWQFVLVMTLVQREQGSLRWSVLRDALWLHGPEHPRTHRPHRRAWWWLVPLVIGFGAEQFVPSPPPVTGRDLGTFLDSPAGRTMFHGAWGWFAVVALLVILNTVLGEELLFRGFLLPRMGTAFGRADWVVNGLLFALYHVHTPWAIPGALLDTVMLSWPSRRFRSAWFGIVVHSAQSLVILAVVLALVLR